MSLYLLRAGVVALIVGAWVGAARAQVVLPAFDATQARAALDLLADAASHGLDPRDYGLPQLQTQWNGDAQAQQALAAAMLRLLTDLHRGRVAPAEIDQRFAASGQPPFDALSSLRAALALQDLPLAVRQAAPALPQYERLRQALAQYRALESHDAWRLPLPPLPLRKSALARSPNSVGKLEPGQAWAAVPLFAARLAALGDLRADALPAEVGVVVYDEPLVAAVRSFQQRHGLEADGVIGASTWAALQVTPRARVRQLELALERLRLTPLLQGPRMIVINIPEFVLRAYEVHGERIDVRLTMKVIVGEAMDTRTPLIAEPMRRIDFKPYWNVPASIARKELAPRLKRDPAFWDREGFEFVSAAGAVDARFDAAQLQAVLDGRARIRQRPGPRNPLGDIKFVFPNRESIYLHHTPSTQLFERARRDFSHGCIRVEQPVALAQFALHGRPEWTEARIREAMARGQTSSVALAEPVPVLIAYGTALVKDGKVHFFDDLYGHDRALDRALRERQ